MSLVSRVHFAVLVFAAVLLRCHSTDAIALPEVGDDVQTLALIVKPDNGALGVFAFDLRDRAQNALAFPSPPNATLYLLQYEKNLEELSFDAGWQQLRADTGGTPLPVADVLFETHLENTSAGEWKMIPVLPDMIDRVIRLDKANPCVRFEVQQILIPDAKGNGRILEPLDDTSALIATDNGYYFLLQDGVPIRQTQISTTTPGYSGVRGADNDLWVLAVDGRVAHGDHLRGFQSAPSLNVPGRGFVWLRGAPPGSPFELYATTDSGTLERFDGTRWTLLEQAPMPPNYSWRGGLAWIRPGAAIAIGPRFPLMLRYENGTLFGDQAFDTLDSPTEVDVFPEVGLVAGSETGLLITYDDVERRWNQIPGTEDFKSPIIVMAPLDRGLLFGGQFGTLQQYQPDIGFCGSQGYASTHITRLKPFGDDFIFFTAEDDELDLREVFILRRIR